MTTTMLSSLARQAKRQAGRLWALGLAAGLAVTMAAIGPADAHGEKSQAAFLRMRTLNWYDVKWSKTNVTVNEEYEITGKLYIMNCLAGGHRGTGPMLYEHRAARSDGGQVGRMGRRHVHAALDEARTRQDLRVQAASQGAPPRPLAHPRSIERQDRRPHSRPRTIYRHQGQFLRLHAMT